MNREAAQFLDPLLAYDDAQGCEVGVPVWISAIGGVVYNAFFVLVKNIGATAISAKEQAVCQTTDRAANGVHIHDGTVSALGWAGGRVASAASLAQNQYGLIQASGLVTAKLSAAAGVNVVAGNGVVLGTTTAGTVEGQNTVATTVDPTAAQIAAVAKAAAGVIGVATASQAVAGSDVVIMVTRRSVFL